MTTASAKAHALLDGVRKLENQLADREYKRIVSELKAKIPYSIISQE